MPATVILGAQWGDEGKGKLVDRLAEQATWVARFQGGNNAGHTVVIGDRVLKFPIYSHLELLDKNARLFLVMVWSLTRGSSTPKSRIGSKQAEMTQEVTDCLSQNEPTSFFHIIVLWTVSTKQSGPLVVESVQRIQTK